MWLNLNKQANLLDFVYIENFHPIRKISWQDLE